MGTAQTVVLNINSKFCRYFVVVLLRIHGPLSVYGQSKRELVRNRTGGLDDFLIFWQIVKQLTVNCRRKEEC